MVIDRRQHWGGLVGWGHGNLVSNAHNRLDPLVDHKPPKNNARRQEYLIFAAPLLTGKPVSVVDFELRPKILEEVILKGDICRDRVRRHWIGSWSEVRFPSWPGYRNRPSPYLQRGSAL